MSQLTAEHDALQSAWRAAQQHWQAAREQWRDEVADRFEREFWQEYDRVVPVLLRELEALDAVVESALYHTA